MGAHRGRTLTALIVGAMAGLGALGLVLADAPGPEGVILMIGGVATMMVYCAWYVVERGGPW